VKGQVSGLSIALPSIGNAMSANCLRMPHASEQHSLLGPLLLFIEFLLAVGSQQCDVCCHITGGLSSSTVAAA
jgi:hypothetical protein